MVRRREAAGLAASILILAFGSTARAQAPRPTPDPSSQGPVGFAPIRSLDILNGIPSMPGTTPASAAGPSASASTDPTASGPAARVPDAPIGPTPVGFAPLPSIRESINTQDTGRVLPPIGVSSWFRKARGRAGSPAPFGRTTPSVSSGPAYASQPRSGSALAPAPTSVAVPRPRVDPATVPSAFPEPMPMSEPEPAPLPVPAEAAPGPSRAAPGPTTPAGRLSPYANQVPATARPQAEGPRADPSDPAPAGRPAPLASDAPASPRPRAAAGDRPQGPRPTASATTAPRPQGPRPRTAGAEPAPAPAPAPVEPETAPAPEPATSPLPPAVVPPPPPPIDPPGAAAAETLRVDPVAEIVPVGLPPDPAPAAVVVAAPPPEPAPRGPVIDAEVMKTSGVDSATAVRLKQPNPKPLTMASLRAASVGDEIITFRELDQMVTDRYREAVGDQDLPREQKAALKNQLAATVLDGLIDQRVVLQEVHRATAKNAKAVDQFNEFADKKWKEDELPPLLRSTATSNEYELKKKLAEVGKSYDDMKEGFRRSMLANDFLMSKIRPKVSADLIEQKAYYYDHLKDYQQPARMNWREIEINFGSNRGVAPKYADRAAALRQAEATLARLAKGEDFDAVARGVSDGPTASKGGLYVDMTPGGYGIPPVNEELNRLPVGKVSGIIEAPNAFHIVRIDSKREAGPLRFDEVHEKIRDEVFRRNYMKAKNEYLAKLRSRTLIRTMFDNTESDPSRARNADPAVRAASR